MKNNTIETITITRETYDLIKEYMHVLDELSDDYLSDCRKKDSEITHILTARWAVAYEIIEAIEGNTESLIDSIASTKRKLEARKTRK